MRRIAIVAPVGPDLPRSCDPLDVVEHGLAPRWRVCGGALDEARLLRLSQLRDADRRLEMPDGAVMIRLPRRLSAQRRAPGWRATLRERRRAAQLAAVPVLPRAPVPVEPYPKIPVLPAEDVLRWICGQAPVEHERHPRPEPRGPAFMWLDIGSPERAFEQAYPRRGLGMPKLLPRRRVRPQPLTLATLRRAAAELDAAGVARNPDGTFDVRLSPAAMSEILADNEFQRLYTWPDDLRDGVVLCGLRLREDSRGSFGGTWGIGPEQPSLAQTFATSRSELATSMAQRLNDAAGERLAAAYPERTE